MFVKLFVSSLELRIIRSNLEPCIFENSNPTKMAAFLILCHLKGVFRLEQTKLVIFMKTYQFIT